MHFFGLERESNANRFEKVFNGAFLYSSSLWYYKLNYCRFTSEYLEREKKAVIMQCFIECEKLSFAFKSHFTGFNGNNNNNDNSMNNKCNRLCFFLRSVRFIH